MQSHWGITHSTYKAVQETVPLITKFTATKGLHKMEKTPVHKHIKKIHPDIYRIPLFRRKFCKMMLNEIGYMNKHFSFEPNEHEDELRQIPEIVLKETCPEIYRNMWFVVQTVLNPIFMALWQRQCSSVSSVQIANYNLVDKKQGAWHHDESADMTVVVPLNTGKYKGGGTEFHNYGVVNPIPTGHALIFPSFTNLHRGLAVDSGDRYLLVFWLYDRSRVDYLYENASP